MPRSMELAGRKVTKLSNQSCAKMWSNAQINNWYNDQNENGGKFQDSDPIEVRALKRQLAQLTFKHGNLQGHPRTVFKMLETAPDFCDQGVQVKYELRKNNQNTQASSDLEKSNVFYPYPHNSPICPTCYTFAFLNSGVSHTKVMKDEELETDFGTRNITQERSVENVYECVSSTTSITSPVYSSVAFHDYSSECLSDDGYRHRSPKRSCHEVTFLDDLLFGRSLPENGMTKTHQSFCVDNFIDSIRPPIN